MFGMNGLKCRNELTLHLFIDYSIMYNKNDRMQMMMIPYFSRRRRIISLSHLGWNMIDNL